jgi:hypothetical protein
MMDSITESSLGEFVANCGAFSPRTSVRIERHGYESGRDPFTSIIVPVHNQERVIRDHLESLRLSAASEHEIIVVVDGCTDETAQVVRAWSLDTDLTGQTRGVTIVIVGESVFETISDTLGAKLAIGAYLIEVQADMQVWESGFDRVLISALKAAPELVAVSGRGAHSFDLVLGSDNRVLARGMSRLYRGGFALKSKLRGSYRPSGLELRMSDSIGRTGLLIQYAPNLAEPRAVFVHETIMRGPLAIRRDDFEMLGGFDTEKFFLGNDDHDLAMRALVHHGRRVGYVPIGFDSPIELGTTRAPRPIAAQTRFAELKAHYDELLSGSELVRHMDRIGSPRRYKLPFEIGA